MKTKSTILRIAVPCLIRQCLEYLIPEDMPLDNLAPGIRVDVPFGKQHKIGILVSCESESTYPIDKLKPISAIIDKEPLLNEPLIQLINWISQYYHHPIGEVATSCLPKILRDGSPIKITTIQSCTESTNETSLVLNEAQENAIQKINHQDGFGTFLLEGVTGSGKTEVYLQVIEKIIKEGKQALVLVPEIGLTPQTVSRFQRRFNLPIAIMHSRLNEKERMDAWLNAKNGQAKVIIGTRSAILTPFKNLGIIIVDEEHDMSFKQQAGLRYSAREVSIMRAKFENVPIILGTATPSLETLYNASRQRFHHLHLLERAGTAVHPSFKIIDLRNQQLHAGLSTTLLTAIQQHLNANQQVMVFLNRRGYAPTLICHACGWLADCPHCDAHLTLHSGEQKLLCHHCGTTRPIYKHCLSCKQSELLAVGLGTERLEEVLQEKFKNNSIIRLDRDSTRTKNSIHEILSEIQSGQGQIIIGTQMLAKGHHFPNVTLVAIIDADSGLFSSDFRASERLGQLITQVSGRAGREEKPGEVYIQTHHPENTMLQTLITEGYSSFAIKLLEERKLANLPPYSHLAILRAEAKSAYMPNQFLQEARKVPAHRSLEILGPIPAMMQKKAGQYRANLLIQTQHRTHLQRWLPTLLNYISQLPSSRKVRWSLDIDPQEI